MSHKVNTKFLLVGMMGFFISRVAIYGMHPVAIAFFTATYAKNKLRSVVFFSVMMGLLSSVNGMDVAKYGMSLVVTVVIHYLMERMGRRPTHQQLGLIGAVVTMLLTASNVVFQADRMEYMLLALLEAVLILTLSYLFSWGLDVWMFGNKGQALNNEQMISIIVMVAFSLCGLPEMIRGFSIRESLAYLMVLFMGYKYGAGAGAITGAAVGASQMEVYGMSYVGVSCIIGIMAGTFRELGRLGSGASFLLTGLGLHYVMGEGSLAARQIGALASGCILFFFMPNALLYKVDGEDGEISENVLVKHSYQTLANNKLKEFSDAFQNLANKFYKTAKTQEKIGKQEVLGMFDRLSKKICAGCSNCTLCWEKHYYDTYHEALSMVQLAEENGSINHEDVSPEFAARCIHFEEFVRETGKNVEFAKWNLSWSNKLAESRALIAGQLSEVANIIRDFSMDLCEMKEVPYKQKEELLSVLRVGRVKVKKLSIMERRGKKMEIHLVAKIKKNDCVTAREVAAMLGEVMGKRFKPEDSMKNVLPKEYEELVFMEDANYKTLTGIARITKKGERVSGDNFSFLHLNNGELIMVLSDGMGTGYHAYRESESVVELLENLLEAGFREESAIRLINSVLVLQSERQSFSTLDVSVIDLYSGVCEFVKNGASATFIKREGWIETIRSDALPIGVLKEAEPEGFMRKLYHGDLVVMVTDGVMDCFPDEDKEFYMENLLINVKSNNPQEVANSILNHALEKCERQVMDDMSVLVAGIWEKQEKGKW